MLTNQKKETIDMADNYLQFAETLNSLTKKQAAWLQQQLELIVVVRGKEFSSDEKADCNAPDYQGLRFLRDYNGRQRRWRQARL